MPRIRKMSIENPIDVDMLSRTCQEACCVCSSVGIYRQATLQLAAGKTKYCTGKGCMLFNCWTQAVKAIQ